MAISTKLEMLQARRGLGQPGLGQGVVGLGSRPLSQQGMVVGEAFPIQQGAAEHLGPDIALGMATAQAPDVVAQGQQNVGLFPRPALA